MRPRAVETLGIAGNSRRNITRRDTPTYFVVSLAACCQGCHGRPPGARPRPGFPGGGLPRRHRERILAATRQEIEKAATVRGRDARASATERNRSTPDA